MSLPKPGDRIRLVHMDDDPDPIPPGTEGTVLDVVNLAGGMLGDRHQVTVKWDIARSLNLCIPPDTIEILTPKE